MGCPICSTYFYLGELFDNLLTNLTALKGCNTINNTKVGNFCEGQVRVTMSCLHALQEASHIKQESGRTARLLARGSDQLSVLTLANH